MLPMPLLFDMETCQRLSCMAEISPAQIGNGENHPADAFAEGFAVQDMLDQVQNDKVIPESLGNITLQAKEAAQMLLRQAIE